MQDSMFIGLDVHKATISVVISPGERGGEVRHWGMVPHRPDYVRKLVEKLAASGGRLHFCYEAGRYGHGLYRQLVERGHDCIVMAPSLIPVKAGDRAKTDRRDARELAKLHRAGELTAVWVPDAAHEAMRDLVRAQATAIRVLGTARQHLQGLLLRHDRIYPGKKGWIGACCQKNGDARREARGCRASEGPSRAIGTAGVPDCRGGSQDGALPVAARAGHGAARSAAGPGQ